MFKAISIDALLSVSGGKCRCNNGNTGITGGMDVPNNDVPCKKAKNTGITGGMDVPNNKVP